MAVEGIFVMIFDPLVMFPEDVNPDGAASAAKITCPFGRIAPGASSAPNGEGFPFSVPIMSGPAAQVGSGLVEGSKSAVCWVAPITSMRPSCSRRTGPSSKPTLLPLNCGIVPTALPSDGLMLDQMPVAGLYFSA